MPFIPDSQFGIAYAVACFATLLLASFQTKGHSLNLAIIMAAYWVTLRGLSMSFHDVALVWVLHDAVTMAAFIAYGLFNQSRLSFACASVFFVVMLFDQLWFFNVGGFTSNAAVAEAGGYLCFLMIAGDSIGHFGGGYRGSSFRRGNPLGFMAVRRSFSRHADMPLERVSATKNTQETNSGTA